MRGYPVFRVPTEAPRPTSGEAVNSQVGPIFWRPAQLSWSFYSAVDGEPQGGAGARGAGAPTINDKKRWLRAPGRVLAAEGSKVGDVDGGPLGVLAAGPAAATTEVRDINGGPPRGCWQYLQELEVRERPPSTWKHWRRAPGRCQSWRSGSAHHQHEKVDDGPPGGAEAEGPIGSIIKVKTSTADPREVPQLKVRERPPSTWKRRRRSPGRCRSWRSESVHHQRENVDDGPPEDVGAEGPGAPTINVKTSTTAPWEVSELEIRERAPSTWKRRRRGPGRCRSWRSGSAHHQRENVDNGPPGGAGDEGPGAPTINMKMSTTGPQEVPELDIRERSACGAHLLGRAVNGCRNLETNVQRVVRTHFTLTQVGHFYWSFFLPAHAVCPP
jgi:hypothetical protein